MPIYSHVGDDDSREGIFGITVVVTDAAGKNLISPVITDYDGSFTLPDEPFKDSAGKKIRFSGPGYETKEINASDIGVSTIFLTPVVQIKSTGVSQDSNVKAKGIKKDYSLVYIFGTAAVFCFVMAIIIKH
jgi:hypothetical protein